MEKDPDRCILCGGLKRTLLIRKAPWSVYRCGQCGLGVLDPMPDREALQSLYDEAYFRSHYREGLTPGSQEMKRRIRQEDHRLRFFRPCKKTGKVLDIGCGMGYFLYACREKGYEVEGLDVSEDAASYVRQALKITVRTGEIEEMDIPGDSFDVITLWHSLEHMRRPDRCLEKIRMWLKADGILIVDVPNHEGTDAREAWTNWADWDLPYHFYHFTPGTLNIMLRKHGFQTVREKTYHSEYVKEKLGRHLLTKPFARLVAKGFSGNSVAVVARKTKV